MEKNCNQCTNFKTFTSCVKPEIQKKYFDKKSKKLFLGLSWLSLFIIYLISFTLLYLITPRIYEFGNHILFYIITFLTLSFLFILTGGLTLITLTVIFEKDLLYPHGEKSVTIKVLYPIAYFLSKLLKIKREDLGNSFVEVNNAMIRALAKAGRINPERILILLPHCIQYHDCKLRVTNNIETCAKCGKCDIAEILKLKEKYNIQHVNIATGGTLARKIIIDTKPTVIIAVACERDLVDGIQDAYPILVYGVLNIRYNGPCFDTLIPINELDKALNFITSLK